MPLLVLKMKSFNVTAEFYHPNKKLNQQVILILLLVLYYFSCFTVTYSRVTFKKPNSFFYYLQLLSHYILNYEYVPNENT